MPIHWDAKLLLRYGFVPTPSSKGSCRQDLFYYGIFDLLLNLKFEVETCWQ